MTRIPSFTGGVVFGLSVPVAGLLCSFSMRFLPVWNYHNPSVFWKSSTRLTWSVCAGGVQLICVELYVAELSGYEKGKRSGVYVLSCQGAVFRRDKGLVDLSILEEQNLQQPEIGKNSQDGNERKKITQRAEDQHGQPMEENNLL